MEFININIKLNFHRNVSNKITIDVCFIWAPVSSELIESRIDKIENRFMRNFKCNMDMIRIKFNVSIQLITKFTRLN